MMNNLVIKVLTISSYTWLTLSLTSSFAANVSPPSAVQQVSSINESSSITEILPIRIPLIVGSQLPESTYTQPSLTALNRYLWRLTQVTDEQSQTTAIPTDPPLVMDIQPNKLLFYNICNRYRFHFSDRLFSDFPYQMHHSDSLSMSCTPNAGNSDETDLVSIGLKSTLQYTDGRGFGFKWLTQTADSATVALKVDQGKTLIWQGDSKPDAPIIGLPITTKLLESYQWHLVSAIDNSNKTSKPIADFYYPDVPISAHFSTNDQRSRVYFDDTCNGVSGGYLLTADQELMIGQHPSTDMGCSIERNRIESKLEKLMHNSTSQLHLSLQPSNQKTEDFPRYNLLQTMETGETLVWQNTKKPKRSFEFID